MRPYEDLYCARGDMENRIKEGQTDMFAGRTSAASMRANQLRLWFAAFAYVLICALRRIGLTGTAMAVATCGTIRLKLLKIGALVTTSVRRIKIAMASSCPTRTSLGTPSSDYLRPCADAPPTPTRNNRGSMPKPEAAHPEPHQLRPAMLTRSTKAYPDRSPSSCP